MQVQDEIARYKALLNIARRLGQAMDLDTLIDEILDTAQEVMRAEACSLLLPDRVTCELIVHATHAEIARLPAPPRIPSGQGIAGAVFTSKKTLNIRDAQRDPRHYRSLGQELGFVTRALLTVPLLNGAECLGVMQVLNARGREYFDAQDEEIFEGFGGLIVSALLRLEAHRIELEQEGARQELVLAQEIQQSFLPASVQKLPFCEVHFKYFPARMVGGDFYFIHSLGQRVLLGLGDVSGKGVPAALTMARITSMMQARVDQLGEDLGAWVTALNRQVTQDLKAGRFVTLTFLLADAAQHSLQICAAGQSPPLRCDPRGWRACSTYSQLPLGISASVTYAAQFVDLNRREFWLAFSDGITEARNASGDDYTLERFRKDLPLGQTAGTLVDTAVANWRRYVGDASQHDDASLLLLDWRGLPPAGELDLKCCPENLKAGRAFIERWAEYAGFDEVTVGQIVMACDEAASNVFRHGYAQQAGPLRYEASIEDGMLAVMMIDSAKSVEVDRIQGRELSDLRPGGLGTFIITHVFDEVQYMPYRGGTILKLRKKLSR